MSFSANQKISRQLPANLFAEGNVQIAKISKNNPKGPLYFLQVNTININCITNEKLQEYFNEGRLVYIDNSSNNKVIKLSQESADRLKKNNISSLLCKEVVEEDQEARFTVIDDFVVLTKEGMELLVQTTQDAIRAHQVKNSSETKKATVVASEARLVRNGALKAFFSHMILRRMNEISLSIIRAFQESIDRIQEQSKEDQRKREIRSHQDKKSREADERNREYYKDKQTLEQMNAERVKADLISKNRDREEAKHSDLEKYEGRSISGHIS